MNEMQLMICAEKFLKNKVTQVYINKIEHQEKVSLKLLAKVKEAIKTSNK